MSPNEGVETEGAPEGAESTANYFAISLVPYLVFFVIGFHVALADLKVTMQPRMTLKV